MGEYELAAGMPSSTLSMLGLSSGSILGNLEMSHDGMARYLDRTPAVLTWDDITKWVMEEPKDTEPASADDAAAVKSAGILGGVLSSAATKFKSILPSRQPKVRKTILHGMSGIAEPGSMIALMGPSGSGKTTLLNVLAGRTTLNFTGSVCINGVPLSKSMKRSIAYVMQDDIFFDHLSVIDQLMFTASLRLDPAMPPDARSAHVSLVMDRLMLSHIRDTAISDISGGERKRVNIANEILSNTSLILLDEPTSGLDSTAAGTLIATLKAFARDGKRTIVMSIHQPSSHVFMAFDKVLLMGKGHMVYAGAPDKVVGYFGAMGYECPQYYNPSDFIMDLVNDDVIRNRLIDSFSSSKSPLPAITDTPSDTHLTSIEATWAASYWTQLRILIWRNGKNAKNGLFTWLNFMQSVLLALLCGLCWFNMPMTTSVLNDRVGFVRGSSTFTAILSFPTERRVLHKERLSGTFRLSPYFFAKTIAELPMLLLLPLIFTVIAYWMGNLNPDFGRFVGFLAALLVCVMAGESLGLLIGAVFLDMQKALVAGTIAVLGLMLVCGFFVKSLPFWFFWTRYLSWFKYTFDASLIMELSGTVMRCDTADCGFTGTVSGEEAMAALQVEGSYGSNFAISLLFMFALRFAAYLCLRFMHTKNARQ